MCYSDCICDGWCCMKQFCFREWNKKKFFFRNQSFIGRAGSPKRTTFDFKACFWPKKTTLRRKVTFCVLNVPEGGGGQCLRFFVSSCRQLFVFKSKYYPKNQRALTAMIMILFLTRSEIIFLPQTICILMAGPPWPSVQCGCKACAPSIVLLNAL